MGNWSARNYAIRAGVPEAEKHTWEWLHLLGAALGGPNIEGNLVAGTYDGNTQMNTVESAIGDFCAEVFRHEGAADAPELDSMDIFSSDDVQPVIVKIHADLYTPPHEVFAWYIAHTIAIQVTYNQNTIISAEFAGTEAAKYSRLEFDLHRWIAGELFEAPTSYLDQAAADVMDTT
jgi:hypothetical protein